MKLSRVQTFTNQTLVVPTELPLVDLGFNKSLYIDTAFNLQGKYLRGHCQSATAKQREENRNKNLRVPLMIHAWGRQKATKRNKRSLFLWSQFPKQCYWMDAPSEWYSTFKGPWVKINLLTKISMSQWASKQHTCPWQCQQHKEYPCSAFSLELA